MELRDKDIRPNAISASFSTYDLQILQQSLSQLNIAKASDSKEAFCGALFTRI